MANKKDSSGLLTVGIIGGGLWLLSKYLGGGTTPPPPPPPPPPAGKANLYGKVTDLNNVPIPGVSVYVYLTNFQTVTDVNGDYYIDNIDLGAYTVGFRKDVGFDHLFEPVDKSVTLVEGNNLLNVKMTPVSTGATASLYGVVTTESGAPLNNVHVYVENTLGIRVAVTDINGRYEVTGLEAGTRKVTFVKDGYYDEILEIMLSNNERKQLNMSMVPVPAPPPPPPPTGLELSLGDLGISITGVFENPLVEIGQRTDVFRSPWVEGVRTWTLPYAKLAQPIPVNSPTDIYFNWRNDLLSFWQKGGDVTTVHLQMYFYRDNEMPGTVTRQRYDAIYTYEQAPGLPPFDAIIGFNPPGPGQEWGLPSGVFNAFCRGVVLRSDGTYSDKFFWLTNIIAVG